MKKSLLIFLFFIPYISFCQFTLSQLCSYVNLSYDKLDSILTKKGFSFEGVQKGNDSDNSVHTIWNRNKNERLGLVSTPDTVTLIYEDKYNGYTDVLKKGLGFMSDKSTTYDYLLNEVKAKKYVRLDSYAQDKSIVTIYENNNFVITFSKTNTDDGLYYLIRVDDKAYEILKVHPHFDE